MSQRQQRQRDQEKKMIDYFMEMLKTEDLINIGFGKPFQVALRTSQTDKNIPPNLLPQGLMLSPRGNSMEDNHQNFTTIDPVPSNINTLQELKSRNMDNYLSLLKKHTLKAKAQESHQNYSTYRREQSSVQEENPEMQLGICITMSKEDTDQLKKTLVPLFQNIDNVIESGVDPDNIFVMVIVDGMANMDKSLYQYFAYFQRINKSYLQKVQYKLQRLYKQIKQRRIAKQETFLSHFYFEEKEFEQRIKFKPQSVHQRYMRILNQKNEIKKILNGKQVIEMLGQKYFKRMNSRIYEQDDQHTLMKQIGEAEDACNLYLSGKQSLAYVSAYKLPTDAFSIDLKQENPLSNSKYSFIQPLIKLKKMQKNKELNSVKYINLLFCIKYLQTGKIASHNWFFNGFCKELRPKYSAIIDVGVSPSSDSIYKMYMRLKTDESVGGVCGYINKVEQRQKSSTKLQEVDFASKLLAKFFSIRKVEKIQNHLSYLVDKSFESSCGFINLLPTNFSAFRMQTLWSAGQNGQLLKDYFRQLDKKTVTNKIIPSTFTAIEVILRVLLPKILNKNIEEDSEEQMMYNQNINLALDRTLCLGIQKNGKNIAFMPDVQAEVSSNRMVNQVMNKKKQEINGSYYSTSPTLTQFDKNQNKILQIVQIIKQSIFLKAKSQSRYSQKPKAKLDFFLFYNASRVLRLPQKVRRQIKNTPENQVNCGIQFQLSFFSLSGWLSYFSLAIFVFIFHICFEIIYVQVLGSKDEGDKSASIGIMAFTYSFAICIYILVIGAILLFSLYLNHKHKKFKYFIYFANTVLGILSLFNFAVLLFETVAIFVGSDKYLKGQEQLNTFPPQILEMCKFIFKLSIPVILLILTTPCLFYSLLYGKCDRIYDLFSGIFSLIFYLPTYAIIFPIYSKCCEDKISFDVFSYKNQKLSQSWRIIKMINITKYIFWNSIVAFTLFFMSNTIKFSILTLVFMLFGFFKLIQVILAAAYLIYYKLYKVIDNYQASGNQLLINTYRIHQTIQHFEEDFKRIIRKGFGQSLGQTNNRQEYITRFYENF